MTPEEKVAKDACDYLFRIGRHVNARVEFDPVGYLRARIDEAVAAEREACAEIADAEPAALYGPTHGAFDRGYQAGRRDAAKAIRNRKA